MQNKQTEAAPRAAGERYAKNPSIIIVRLVLEEVAAGDMAQAASALLD